ncbi:hypothetical protein AVEN_88643-1 [Araneus ventricosus]|uniref:Uncharacterized protein n=1 Tax=Araneus ventricosus TaxID=182803 RepID=A0A4Y2PEK0_ARAVE|nr:hypothetical protein AVEN_88643-1 [Araneus ventricosus]
MMDIHFGLCPLHRTEKSDHMMPTAIDPAVQCYCFLPFALPKNRKHVCLQFVGLSVFILGLKMKDLLSVLLLIDVPLIAQAVKAVIATGFFISVAGVTGIGGACYETLWLILLHLVALELLW